RQLQIDHDSTIRMKVEPLARCISGEQKAASTTYEFVERGHPFFPRKPAVKERNWQIELLLQVHQRVAKLGKDEQRFTNAANQPLDRRDLCFVVCRPSRSVGQFTEPTLLRSAVR